ncbi:MAG TPA: amidohydrolase family protein [Chloroflexota bacterium]|nr:amidohydrolase family protein [Chloroflexota bacterium]
MARTYRYISGDSHLEIDSKNWIARVPAEHRDRAPRLVRLPNGGDAWLVEGAPLRQNAADIYGGKGRDAWQPFGQRYEDTPGTGPGSQRLREQDVDGIDAEVLFPGQQAGPRLWRNIADDDAYRAVVRAYNDWLIEDYCSADPERLIGVGVIPWTGLDDAIDELVHCANKGFKAVVLGIFPSGKGHPTPEDDRFWAAAVDSGLAITVHVEFDRNGPRGGPLFRYPREPKDLRSGSGVSGLVEQVTNAKFCRLGAVNAMQLVFAGVFDRFPSLRIFFAENQIGWIPFFLEMADVRYDRHIAWAERLLDVKPLPRLPSEYVREHCYWGFQHDRVGIELRRHLGVDRIIWSTDFPHQESDWPNSLEVLSEGLAGVPESEQRKIVAENCIDFFHLV